MSGSPEEKAVSTIKTIFLPTKVLVGAYGENGSTMRMLGQNKKEKRNRREILIEEKGKEKTYFVITRQRWKSCAHLQGSETRQ